MFLNIFNECATLHNKKCLILLEETHFNDPRPEEHGAGRHRGPCLTKESENLGCFSVLATSHSPPVVYITAGGGAPRVEVRTDLTPLTQPYTHSTYRSA